MLNFNDITKQLAELGKDLNSVRAEIECYDEKISQSCDNEAAKEFYGAKRHALRVQRGLYFDAITALTALRQTML